MIDVLAQKIGIDPLKLGLKNAAKKGTQMLSGGTFGHDGYADTIKALLNHPGYTAPLGAAISAGTLSAAGGHFAATQFDDPY